MKAAGACLLGVALAMFLVSGPTGAAGTARPWTPQTSADLRIVSTDPEAPDTWPSPPLNRAIVPSPDGRYFFFITYRGDHVSDTTEGTIHLYRVADVAAVVRDALPESAAQPIFLAPWRKFSFSNRDSSFAALLDVKWQDDSSGITFQAASHSGSTEIWRIDIATGTAARIFRVDGRMTRHEVYGRTISYQLYFSSGAQPGACRNEGPIAWWDECASEGRFESYISVNGHVRQVALRAPVFSPDGQQVAGAISNGATIDAEFRARLALATAPDFVPRPVLNFATGAEPATWYWSADNRHLIVSAAAHPTDAADHSGYIVDYDSTTGEASILEPIAQMTTRGRVVASQMIIVEPGRRIAVRHRLGDAGGADAGTTWYIYGANGWREGARPGGQIAIHEAANSLRIGGFEVRLDHDLNRPPMVIASNGRRQFFLTEPDPVLAEVERAPVELFDWILPDGTVARGGLILPVGRRPGERLPLVIQAYYFYPQLFLPDGRHPTIDMAQSLAARGFAVLMIDAWPSHGPNERVGTGPAGEGRQYVERIDSAVEALNRRGLIDPDRVATTGFSRGGAMSLFAIANPGRVHLAATVIADSTTLAFPEYLFSHRASIVVSDYDAFYGGGSFWENRENWLRYDPILNANRIATPALFFRNGTGDQLTQPPPVIGAFRLNARPFDYMFIPDGPHVLLRPAERIAAHNRALDWLSYWLKGEVDTDPAKAEQYRRWAPLRAQQQRLIEQSRTTARPLPPLPELRSVTFWPDRGRAH